MITVVMTAYNVGQYIEKAISSVLNSSLKDLELIIVEDCSTDNTKELIEEAANKDSRITVIQQPINMGAGWARRTGIEAAKGDYIITIDADDYISPDFLETLYNKAVEHDVDIVCGGVTQLRGDGSYDRNGYGERVVEGDEKVLGLMKERVPFMNNKLISTSLHKKVPYCTRRFIEDMPTITKLMYYANKVVYVNNDGYTYVQRDTSLIHSADPLKNVLYRFLYLQDIAEFFEKENPEMIKKMNIASTYQYYLSSLKQVAPTIEQIELYKDDWVEFTRRLILHNL